MNRDWDTGHDLQEENLDDYWLYCQDCSWEGQDDELVDNEGDGKFNQCPRCGSKNIAED